MAASLSGRSTMMRDLMVQAEVACLTCSTKWGTVGLADFGPLSDADVLITDDGLPVAARTALAEQVGELIVVPTDPEPWNMPHERSGSAP